MEDIFIESKFKTIPWSQLKCLYDSCFPKPPRDVFNQVVTESYRKQKIWLALQKDIVIGSVMLSPYSKGGHLENLAVSPKARGNGVGRSLVERLIIDSKEEGLKLITLTSRIPDFFKSHGFRDFCKLYDGSIVMILNIEESNLS